MHACNRQEAWVPHSRVGIMKETPVINGVHFPPKRLHRTLLTLHTGKWSRYPGYPGLDVRHSLLSGSFTVCPVGPSGSPSSQHRRTPELVPQESRASFRITFRPPGVVPWSEFPARTAQPPTTALQTPECQPEIRSTSYGAPDVNSTGDVQHLSIYFDGCGKQLLHSNEFISHNVLIKWFL